MLISSVYAKTEIDKAFITRGNDSQGVFRLHSPDIIANRQISEAQVYDKFGCNGKNLPPRLAWKSVPKGTKSFAITIYDKDGITGSGWWHWIVYNIPATTNNLDVGSGDNRKFFPDGAVQAVNDYGLKKYSGMCPPDSAKHNYIVTIYALDIENLKIPRNATPAMASLYINQHKIKTATINAFYKKDVGKLNKNSVIKKGNVLQNYNISQNSNIAKKDNTIQKSNVSKNNSYQKKGNIIYKKDNPNGSQLTNSKTNLNDGKVVYKLNKGKMPATSKNVSKQRKAAASKNNINKNTTKNVNKPKAVEQPGNAAPVKSNAIEPTDDFVGPALPQFNNNTGSK